MATRDIYQIRPLFGNIETELEILTLWLNKLQHQDKMVILDEKQIGKKQIINAYIAVQSAYTVLAERPHLNQRTYFPACMESLTMLIEPDELIEQKQIWSIDLQRNESYDVIPCLYFFNDTCSFKDLNMVSMGIDSMFVENIEQEQSLSMDTCCIYMSYTATGFTLAEVTGKIPQFKILFDETQYVKIDSFCKKSDQLKCDLRGQCLSDGCSHCWWRKSSTWIRYQPGYVCFTQLLFSHTLKLLYMHCENGPSLFELLHETCPTVFIKFLEFYCEIKVLQVKHFYISTLCEHFISAFKIFNDGLNRPTDKSLNIKEHDDTISDSQYFDDSVVHSNTNISDIVFHNRERKASDKSENHDSFTDTRKPGSTMQRDGKTVSAVYMNSSISQHSNPSKNTCTVTCERVKLKDKESVDNDQSTLSEDRIDISGEDERADELKPAICRTINESSTNVVGPAFKGRVEEANQNQRNTPTENTNPSSSKHSKTPKSMCSHKAITVDFKTGGNEPLTFSDYLTAILSEDEETDEEKQAIKTNSPHMNFSSMYVVAQERRRAEEQWQNDTFGDRQLIDDSLNSTTKLSDIGYHNGENKALNTSENHIRFTHTRKPVTMHRDGAIEQANENLQTVSAVYTNSLKSRQNNPLKQACNKYFCERANSKAGASVDRDPLTRSEDRIAISREDKKVYEVKQATKTNLSLLNESSTNVVVPAITGPVEEANENQRNISTDDTKSLTLEHSFTSKSMCTHQAGTINLKTGVNEPFTTSKDLTVISSEDEEADVVKQAITMNLPHMNFSSTYVVAPASKGPSEEHGLNGNTSDDNTNRARIGSPNGYAAENAEAIYGAESETQSPQRNASNAIDSVSVDACERESFTEQLRYNTSLPTVEHNENIVVANASGGYGSAMCRDTIQTSFKESEARFDINKDVQVVQKSAPSDEFSNTVDNNHSGENSQQSTPAADETYTSEFPNPAVEISDIQSFEPLMEIVDKIADGERVPPQITMRYEMLRFCTLRSYPKVNKPYITRLAQAGFYYANSSDEVVCYTCARRKRNWQETDIPMDVHRQLNPNCKFLLRNSEVNVPIRADAPGSDMLATLQARFSVRNTNSSSAEYSTAQSNQNDHHTETDTVSGLSERTIQYSLQLANRSSSASRSSNQSTVQQDASVSVSSSHTNSTLPRMQIRAHGNFVQSTGSADSDGRTLTAAPGNALEPLGSGSETAVSQTAGAGGSQTTMPKYPKYASKTVRTTSFNDCNEIVVSPQSLSEAGFFYAGFGDCVRCFQCGVGLRHWSEEDDPWIEHSRWSKDCSYVKQVRGQEFVNLVQMAVQYSQNQSNQENNENGQSEAVAGSNQGANGGDEVENLLHKDSAQSVLEMGYHPDIIRRAIRAVLEVHGREGVTAANLMEKIFEIEEAETPTRTEQNGEVLGHRNQSSQRTTTPNQQSEQSNPEIQAVGASSNNNDSQRPAQSRETHGSEGQSATASGNTESSSKSSNAEAVNTSTLSDSREMTRVSKKQQLLEKKKLKEENEKLKQQSICTNCKEKDVCIVFLPCGHLVTCETCAPKVRYCSVETCKKYIKGTVRTYLA